MNRIINTQIALNINRELKKDFKELVIKNKISIKEVMQLEIKAFIFDYEFTNRNKDLYQKVDEELMNIQLPKKYKERLVEIITEDNGFFKIKEIITFIIKKYIEKNK